MSDNTNYAVSQYLKDKRTTAPVQYGVSDESTFEKVLQGVTTPFRVGSEALASLLLRAQDSSLSLGEAYSIAQGDRTNKEWYQSGDKPATLGQSIAGLFNTDNIDWRSSDEVQRYFHKDGQKILSGGVDFAAALFLDPLNYIGLGAGSKIAKLARADKALLTADKFSDTKSFFEYAKETYKLGPESSSGFTIGTKEYTNELLRLEPYFHNWDKFKSEFGATGVAPLQSETASYLFDGAMFRAINGDHLYTWDAIKNKWVPEQYLSPKVAEIAVSQDIPSEFMSSQAIFNNGFENVKSTSAIRIVKDTSGNELPLSTKYGMYRFGNEKSLRVAHDPETGKFWTLTDSIGDTVPPSNIQTVSDMDAARWDMVNYRKKNTEDFVSRKYFTDEYPNYEQFIQAGDIEIYPGSRFFVDDTAEAPVIYGFDSKAKTFSYFDTANVGQGWVKLNKPSKAQREATANEDSVNAISREQIGTFIDGSNSVQQNKLVELYNEGLPESQQIKSLDEIDGVSIDDFYNQMDTSDEFAGEISNGSSAFAEPISDIEGLATGEFTKVSRLSASNEAVIGDRNIQQAWKEINPSDLDSASHYLLRYISAAGKDESIWVPMQLRVLSRKNIAAIDNKVINEVANDLRTAVPILMGPDGQVYGISIFDEIKPLSDVHLDNQIFTNTRILTELENARAIAATETVRRSVRAEQKKFWETVSSADTPLTQEAIAAERQKIIDELNAEREALAKTLPKNIKALTEKYYSKSESMNREELFTKEELLAIENKRRVDYIDHYLSSDDVDVVMRDYKIEQFLKYGDPEEIRIYNETIKGNKRPISFGFWYDVQKAEDGTYTITSKVRRSDYTGFGQDATEIGTVDKEIFSWTGITEQQLDKLKFNTGKYKDGFITPFPKNKDGSIDSKGAKIWEATLGNSDNPAINVNIDELDNFGLAKPIYPKVATGKIATATTRTGSYRYPKYSSAVRKMSERVRELEYAIAKSMANVTSGKIESKYVINNIKSWEKERAKLLELINDEAAYNYAAATGSAPFGAFVINKPEAWFFNFENELNAITGKSHSVHRSMRPVQDKNLDPIAPNPNKEEEVLTPEQIEARSEIEKIKRDSKRGYVEDQKFFNAMDNRIENPPAPASASNEPPIEPPIPGE